MIDYDSCIYNHKFSLLDSHIICQNWGYSMICLFSGKPMCDQQLWCQLLLVVSSQQIVAKVGGLRGICPGPDQGTSWWCCLNFGQTNLIFATWAQGNTNSWKCGAMSLERHVLRVPPVCLLQGSTRDEPSQAMTSAAWVKSLGTPQKRMVVTNNQHPWSHGLLISEP